MKKKKMQKDTLIYFIRSVLISILGFIISVLYSEMFSTTDYGTYSLVYSSYTLISQFYFGWVSLSILRNAKIYENNQNTNKFFGTFFQLHIMMSIFFFIGGNIIIQFLNLNATHKNLFFILTIVYFFENQLLLINTYLRTKSAAKQYSKNTVINSMLKIVFLLVIYYGLNYKSITVIVLSLLLSELLQCIYLFFKVSLSKYYKKGLFQWNIVKEMFVYGMPLIGISITSWVLNVSDRYIIQYFFSESEVGIYSYAYTLGNSIFNLLMQFIMLGAYPNIVRAWEDRGKEATVIVIKDYLKLYFLIVIPSVFGVIMLSTQFFYFFTNRSYHAGPGIFALTSIGIAMLGFSQYTNKAWELSKKTKALLFLNIFAAIFNVILNIICVPRLGYWSAALTTLVTYIVYITISIIASRKIFILKIDFKILWKIVLSSIIMVLAIAIYQNAIVVDTKIKFIFEVLVGVLVYGLSIIAFKAIDIQSIKAILKREK